MMTGIHFSVHPLLQKNNPAKDKLWGMMCTRVVITHFELRKPIEPALQTEINANFTGRRYSYLPVAKSLIASMKRVRYSPRPGGGHGCLVDESVTGSGNPFPSVSAANWLPSSKI